MWFIVIGIGLVLVYFFLKASGETNTTFRIVTNQWIANKQINDMTDEQIFDLILHNRYKSRKNPAFRQHIKSTIDGVKAEINDGEAFYDYSLPLTLFTIFLIEENKDFINPTKYEELEDVFKAIANVIEEQSNIKQYAVYLKQF